MTQELEDLRLHVAGLEDMLFRLLPELIARSPDRAGIEAFIAALLDVRKLPTATIQPFEMYGLDKLASVHDALRRMPSSDGGT